MNYYDKINWKNRSEGKTTKISAERLNHMDNQIFNNANAIGNVEKIADIGDGTLCGAAETLKETAEKLNQSLSSKVNTTDSRLSDARTPKAHTHDDRYYTDTEINNLLASVTRNHLGVLVKAETITVPAKSSRDYPFPFALSSATIIIAQIPILTGYALGISIGRDATKDFTVRLWNNNDSSQNVNVQYYVVYVA